jgi:hypothetical protein
MYVSFLDVGANRLYRFTVSAETVINIRPDVSRPKIVSVARFRPPKVLSVDRICGGCRHEMSPDYKYCVECGAMLHAS